MKQTRLRAPHGFPTLRETACLAALIAGLACMSTQVGAAQQASAPVGVAVDAAQGDEPLANGTLLLGAQGNFLVAQQGASFGGRATGFDVFGTRRFSVPLPGADADGRRTVAMNADGRFVAVGFAQVDDTGVDLIASRFDANGQPQGEPITVDPGVGGERRKASVAMDAQGGFVVVWHRPGRDHADGSLGVYARRFDAGGAPLGPAFGVNRFAAGDQSGPVVAMEPSGRFVVVWQSQGQDGSGSGIYAQRFSAAGTYFGNEFRVNSVVSANDQSAPILSMGANGDFVMAWNSLEPRGDGSGDLSSVYAKAYFADGRAKTEDRRISSLIGTNFLEDLAADAQGGFGIIWRREGANAGIESSYFSGDGQSALLRLPADPFAVALPTALRLAVDADGDPVFSRDVIRELVRGCDDFGCDVDLRHFLNVTRLSGNERVDVAVSLAIVTDPVNEDGTRQLAVTLRNTHPFPALSGNAAQDAHLQTIGEAAGLRVSLLFPFPTEFIQASSGWSCAGDRQLLDCQRVRPLAAGTGTRLDVSVRSFTSGTVALSSLSHQFDPNVANDRAEQQTTVTPAGVVDASLSKTRMSRPEGEVGTVNIVLSRPSSRRLSIPLIVGGTATEGVDYALTGPVTFNPGQTRKTVAIQSLADTLDEHDETVTIRLGAADGVRPDPNQLFTFAIGDTTEPSVLAFAASSMFGVEGELLHVAVNLDRPSAKPIVLKFRLEPRTASAGSDYYASSSQSARIDAGQSGTTIPIRLVRDGVAESPQDFVVVIDSAINATVGTPSSTRIRISDP